MGSGLCTSQCTMEQTNSNLTEEIHLPLNPYANLSQRGLCHCQVNALLVMYPELELTKDHLPGVPETLAMATHYSGLWRRMHIPCAYVRQKT